MVMISSEEGYPEDGKILTRTEYFIRSPPEGLVLVVGKDSKGVEYRPKVVVPGHKSGCYTTPSNVGFAVPIGSDPAKNHPALFFPFSLRFKLPYPEVLDTEEFDDAYFDRFDLTLMDGNRQVITSLPKEVERIFKECAVWGAYELQGQIRNHFWGEMYRNRTPELERFLEDHRA